MATVAQLERLDREILTAERRALRNLASHLRGAVLDMPEQSRLALAFVRHARKFELWATGSAPDLWGNNTLENLELALKGDDCLIGEPGDDDDTPMSPPERLIRIEDLGLGLSVRAYNVLVRLGIHTVADYRRRVRENRDGIPGLGAKGREQVEEAIRAYTGEA